LRIVKASSSRLGQYSRSARGTITLATVSHTPMKWMVGQREEVMRANCAARSNLSFGSGPSSSLPAFVRSSTSLPRPVPEYRL
jgi:hypothetical protein